MRVRLREMPDPGQLARMYARPHDHRIWPDHLYRVDVTTAVAGRLLPRNGRVADLSCGNAHIARSLHETNGAQLTLGDLAPGYEHHGPIEQTIDAIGAQDLFICSETIEHLDNPDAVLAKIRRKTGHLILSTPDGEKDDSNPEHVWGWDAETVEKMLTTAGFTPIVHTTVDTSRLGGYVYQIWACR